jgi:dGTPase
LTDTESRSGRTSFEIDADRIIHSSSFRELQYKTQVQGLVESQSVRVFRTRLNHVLEVAQIGEGIARLVGGNEGLCKAIALAHDLGHPPFGHAGERALRDELRERGRLGWNANVHSLAVVDDVEAFFIGRRGLDLTWATREGIARHSTPFDEPISFGEFTDTPSGGLECQIVDAADVFAYLSHDLDDAAQGGFVTLDELRGVAPLLGELIASAYERWGSGERVWPEAERDVVVRRRVVATLLNRLIMDAAENTMARIEAANIQNPDDVRRVAKRVVQSSAGHAAAVDQLRTLLTTNYYRSEEVARTDKVAERVVRRLLDALIQNPDKVPDRFRQGDEVLDAATYLASLNDHSALALAPDLEAA